MKYKKFLTIAGITASILLSNSIYAQEVEPQQIEPSTTISSTINPKEDAVSFDSSMNEIPFFELVQKGVNSKKTFIFVGGVNDSYNFWDKQIALLKKDNPDNEIIGYQGIGAKGSHPHNIEYMENNAQHIAEGIQKLKDSGYKDIEIYSHSLGGVVSKRALHILEEKHAIDDSINISFTAVSSPFGGFSAAIIGQFTPFIKPITKFFKLAMAGDMSPISDFYESISKPLPKTIKTTMIESLYDSVAQPNASITKYRYEKIATTFDNRIILQGDHEFSSDPKKLEEPAKEQNSLHM